MTTTLARDIAHPLCQPCRDTNLRRRNTPLDETMRQMQRCGGCGDYYMFHRAQHPHLLVTPRGEVRCGGWQARAG